MRQQEKKRRSIGIRGQLMWFLCLICLLLLGMFWFLSTQLLEPLYTKHIQKQLTEEADLIGGLGGEQGEGDTGDQADGDLQDQAGAVEQLNEGTKDHG